MNHRLERHTPSSPVKAPMWGRYPCHALSCAVRLPWISLQALFRQCVVLRASIGERVQLPRMRSETPRSVGACFALLLVTLAGPAPLAGVGIASAAESGTRSGAAREHKTAAKKGPRASAETPFGREGDPRKVKRVLTIETSDAMRYFPDQIRVKKGQTVRLLVRNGGQLPHEVVIGTMDDLKKHAALTRRNGEGALEAPNIARVEPGATGRIDWQFTKAGEFYYGCLTPGHFDAGMIGTIVVR